MPDIYRIYECILCRAYPLSEKTLSSAHWKATSSIRSAILVAELRSWEA